MTVVTISAISYYYKFAQYLPDMSIPFNLLDEPRILFNLAKDNSSIPEDVKQNKIWYSPPRGEHESFLSQICHVYSENRPWTGNLNQVHGFLIEPDSSSYSR